MTAVLLDLDGTLVDSRAAIVAAVNATLAARGLPERPAAELVPRIGPPLHDTLAALTGLDGPGLDAVVADYRARYRELMVPMTPVFDGVPELLDRLAGAGLPLAVATSKARPLARELLEGLGLAARFAAICGPEPPARDAKEVTVGQALAALGTAAGPAPVMVGDRRHDVHGAHAHGLRCVGVLWGVGDAAELRAAGADALATSPVALGDLLLGP